MISQARLMLSLLALNCCPALLLFSCIAALAQEPKKAPPQPGPMLADGVENFDTPDFKLSLVRSSQTIAALHPKTDVQFDFTPGDRLTERSHDGYYHLGDIDIRLRVEKGEWKDSSTAFHRTPVKNDSHGAGVLAAADLSNAFSDSIPLQVIRSWGIIDGKLTLRFTFSNHTNTPVEIGGLGVPMVFNNDMNERTLEQAHAICSFSDPYIGQEGGYLQVTRLNGRGPALLVIPEGKTSFEAYKPILSPRWREHQQPKPEMYMDLTPRGMTFEGFYDWMVVSRAFAENEWKKAQPWNPPTSRTIVPNESWTVGFQFVLAPSIQNIEAALAENHRPVAVGIPGYVLPKDIHAQLFLRYAEPVKSIDVEPAGAIDIQTKGEAPNRAFAEYVLTGKQWGRARLTVTYADGLTQAIHYFVMKPQSEAVASMGRFLTHEQWFDDPKDPFHRAPSVMTYDREANHIVTQDSRVWIAGLSDEGGAGSWLAAAMKEYVEPVPEEVAKLEQFVDAVVWGGLQFKDGPKKYGVRKSLFYYQPDEFPASYYRSDLDWKSWTSWNKQASEAVDRSFNYPHVAAAYWVLYRLARNHMDLVKHHSWDWYLEQAYQTSLAMTRFAPDLAQFGQMEGDIFVAILTDLKAEGKNEQAAQLEAAMKARADHWKSEAYPFGSEMPWDSTGQEEVYAWSKYFGYNDKAKVTVNAIIGYMPTIPHWGYNGSARRYWDFLYAGKYSRIERQLHHYGSGINAIPLLAEYREHPDDFHLLRAGYGGVMGALTDIDEQGYEAPAFHAFPDMLRFDPLSGDNGPNFFGHAWNTGTYVVNHPDFGWICFGGNISVSSDEVTVEPRDDSRTRFYLAPAGTWLTLDSGQFERLVWNEKTGKLRIALAAKDGFTAQARLRIEQPARPSGVGTFRVAGSPPLERGAYVISLSSSQTWVELTR
jgi:Family of unknown function (DUF5695)